MLMTTLNQTTEGASRPGSDSALQAYCLSDESMLAVIYFEYQIFSI